MAEKDTTTTTTEVPEDTTTTTTEAPVAEAAHDKVLGEDGVSPEESVERAQREALANHKVDVENGLAGTE